MIHDSLHNCAYYRNIRYIHSSQSMGLSYHKQVVW